MPRDYFDIENETKDVISDAEKQDKVLEFIAQVSRKTCPDGEYDSWLQDGRIIEEVIYKSCPTPLGQRKKSGPLPLGKQISDKDRIEKIINDLFEFGVGVEFLFDVDDLLLNKNMKKAAFTCSVCKEKFSRSDQLRGHLCEAHPDQIGQNLRSLLTKMTC